MSRLITLLPLSSSPLSRSTRSPPQPSVRLSKTFSLPPFWLTPFRRERRREGVSEEIDSSRVVETKMAKIAGNSGCDDDSFPG